MNTDDLYRLLRTSHAQAQSIVDTVADPLLVLDAGFCVLTASRSFFAKFGVDRYETIGKSIFELGNGQWDIPELHQLLSEVIPRSAAIIDFEVVHEFPGLGRRTMLLTARTLFQPDGGGHSILLTISDATDQRARDANKDLLFGELRHRMKNLLALVQALARQTPTADRTADQFRDELLGRLGALIEAESLGFDGSPGTDLKTMIEHILAPYSCTASCVTVDSGPPVNLSSKQVMFLAMVLHEMATNAAKYGALASENGHVHVRWRLREGGDRLELEWSESGEPRVVRPESHGFGSALIRATVERSLDGSINLDFTPEGLRALLTFPIRAGDGRV